MAAQAFRLTKAQLRAQDMLAGDATNCMLYGGSRCVSGDTVLDGHDLTIVELAEIGAPVRVLTSHGWQTAEAPFRKGVARLWRFDLECGRSVTVTDDHRFWDGDKWAQAWSLARGDSIAVRLPGGIVRSAQPHPGAQAGDTPDEAGYDLSRIVSISQALTQPYYTLHVPGCEHYFANGILHHNSGKTFLILRAIAIRAMLAPSSRHACFRFRFNHIKTSIIHDTWPTMMRLCFPDQYDPKGMDRTDWFYTFRNGSEVWFSGLDDKERTEKVLGQEFATLFFNECSQIPWNSRNLAMTRLAQLVKRHDGVPLRLKAVADANPPSQAHWTYRAFVQKLDPLTRKPWPHPEDFAVMQMNPRDNVENLSPDYIRTLEALPAKDRLRFLEGQFGAIGDGLLWYPELCEQQRHMGELPDMQRIIIAVDPSGASGEEGERSDEIGIIVAGLGVDGRGYVLEDLSGKFGPETWGKIAVDTYDRYDADAIVAETNFGGDMVRAVVAAAASGKQVMYKEVKASRGKVVRAEPIAVLFETDKARFAGHFPDLEDQLCSATVNGYTGDTSPDRMDSMVWAFTELFPKVTKRTEDDRTPAVQVSRSAARMNFQPQVHHRR